MNFQDVGLNPTLMPSSLSKRSTNRRTCLATCLPLPEFFSSVERWGDCSSEVEYWSAVPVCCYFLLTVSLLVVRRRGHCTRLSIQGREQTTLASSVYRLSDRHFLTPFPATPADENLLLSLKNVLPFAPKETQSNMNLFGNKSIRQGILSFSSCLPALAALSRVSGDSQ